VEIALWSGPRLSDPVALVRHVGDVEQHAFAVGLRSRGAPAIGVVACVDRQVRTREVAGLEGPAQVDDLGAGGAEA
jgi:hypothetical protein